MLAAQLLKADLNILTERRLCIWRTNLCPWMKTWACNERMGLFRKKKNAEADELQSRGLSLRRKACVYNGSTGLDTRNDCRLSWPACLVSTETRMRYMIIRAAQKANQTASFTWRCWKTNYAPINWLVSEADVSSAELWFYYSMKSKAVTQPEHHRLQIQAFFFSKHLKTSRSEIKIKNKK